MSVSMDYRVLGTTGISVSTFALGTMMFGAWGNPDAAECTAMVHRALDAGINLVDTAKHVRILEYLAERLAAAR